MGTKLRKGGLLQDTGHSYSAFFGGLRASVVL